MAATKSEAKSWLHNVVINHLASNARRYSAAVYNTEPSINSTLGLQFDLQPAEGKVVDENEIWCLIKTERAHFFVCEKALMEMVPDVGSTVRVTPYARRGFDGFRLDTPKKQDAGNGVMIQTFVIGETRSKLPIDVDSLKSEFLKDMIHQVEELKAPDGVRRVCQVFVDAGADQGPVSFKDPSDEEVIAMPPSLQFRCNTKKHDGWVNLVYDRAMDYYKVQLVEHDTWAVVQEVDNVDFTSLAEVVVDLIDDGQWQIAKVEVLKAAPRKVKKAA